MDAQSSRGYAKLNLFIAAHPLLLGVSSAKPCISMIGKVILNGLEFHAYHGVYPHERSSGNKFEVDVEVETKFTASAFHDDLAGTVDYEDLYALVKAEMNKPSKLLETVGHAIAVRALETFPNALSVLVNISKFNPPIGGVCKKATVSVSRTRAS